MTTVECPARTSCYAFVHLQITSVFWKTTFTVHTLQWKMKTSQSVSTKRSGCCFPGSALQQSLLRSRRRNAPLCEFSSHTLQPTDGPLYLALGDEITPAAAIPHLISQQSLTRKVESTKVYRRCTTLVVISRLLPLILIGAIKHKRSH